MDGITIFFKGKLYAYTYIHVHIYICTLSVQIHILYTYTYIHTIHQDLSYTSASSMFIEKPILTKLLTDAECDTSVGGAGHPKKKLKRAENEVIKCGVCSQMFGFFCELKVHMRRHTGERPYPCNHCEAAFTLRGSLNKHLRTVHSIEQPMKSDDVRETEERAKIQVLKSRVSGRRPYWNRLHNEPIYQQDGLMAVAIRLEEGVKCLTEKLNLSSDQIVETDKPLGKFGLQIDDDLNRGSSLSFSFIICLFSKYLKPMKRAVLCKL